MNNDHRPAGLVDKELRLWLSPLPLLMDGPPLESCPCPHERTDACLSLRAPAQVGPQLAMLFLAIPAAALAVTYFALAQSVQGILLSLAAYLGLSVLILWLILGKIMNNYAVFFHRHRREVMFLHWNPALKRTEMILHPWEKLCAWVPASRPDITLTLTPHLTPPPDSPLEYCFKHWRGKNLGLPLWRAICRYMELGPEHFPESTLQNRPGRRPPPPELNAWKQPLPYAHRTPASLESTWYNTFLTSIYPEKHFLDLGIVEKSIPYPGPREAAEQLKENTLTPGFGGLPELRRRAR